MTANRRIALNIIATYGRSLYALVIGLFCGRWTLMALGQVDYGLMGLVGGLTGFISFFNARFAAAIGRFYALSVGEQRANKEVGLENCRMWFTTAVIIHTTLPLILMIIGYPIGEWAVRHYLTIPMGRIEDCVWVWRFVCVSCFLSMVSVPMNAMYRAHQYIAELTVYSFVTVTLNAFFLHYMVTHPGVWLVKFMFWRLMLGLVPHLIISLRTFYLFPECRFVLKYVHCWANVKQLGSYIVWSCFGTFGGMLRSQGVSILVNKMFGPRMNASVSVGIGLYGHTNTLSGSLAGAFSPAIFNAWGARKYDEARDMAYRVCKLGVLCMLIFSVPLALEVDEVLHLWLENPPEYAARFCLFVMASAVIDKTAIGHMYLVSANGKIAKYQMVLGTSLIMTLPIAYVFVKMGLGMNGVGLALVVGMMGCAWGRVWFARRLVGLSARYWIWRIFLPLLAVTTLSLLVGWMPRLFMDRSFWRICTTTGFVEVILLPLSWLFLLDSGERDFIKKKLFSRICGLLGRK